jgi:outer membrane protein TolC
VALAERDNAKEAEKTANESLIQARENLETVLSQYEVEEVSRIEFTDAVSSYTEALGNRVKSFYRGQMAEAALFELIGMIPQYNEENVMEKRK